MLQIQVAVASTRNRLSVDMTRSELLGSAQMGERIGLREGISGVKLLWKGTPMPAGGDDFPKEEIDEAWDKGHREFEKQLKSLVTKNAIFEIYEHHSGRWVKDRVIEVI